MESSAAEFSFSFSFSFGSRGSQVQAEAGGFHGVGGCDDMAWVVEKGNDLDLSLGDDFMVDDLLDFGQLETETETEGEDDDDDNTKEEEHQNRNKKHHQIQQQQKQKQQLEEEAKQESFVSFEALPLPVSELTLPAHDAAELEWVSRIVDDSLSEFPTYPASKLDTHKRTQPFLPHHPMPMPMPMVTIPVKAKRSKRATTLSCSSSCSSSSSWGSGVPLLFIDSFSAPSSTTTSSTSSSSSSSCSSSSCSSSSKQQQFIFGHQLFDEIPVSVFPHHQPPNNSNSKSLFLNKQKQKPKPKPKKRGRKPKSLVMREGAGNSSMSGGVGGERGCSHCGVNKTPQWRTGPEGAKTLCNACGVRYKSGRLVPEYRPACSPTFVSHVHSNSHRKVLEMRRNKEEEESKLLLVSSAVPVPSF